MKDTAIVILNWNGQKFLEDFLPGVIEHSSAFADIIVADNDSSDNSVEWLKSEHPGIRVIENGENGGFAKGYNDALAHLEHEYFLLLNSDIEVTAAWLEPMISRIKSDKNIFSVQPGILSYYARDKFEYAGAAGGFIDKLGYPFCRGRIFDVAEVDEGQYNESTDIFWSTGACMLVRAELYRELGGLDNYFFAHMEEIDLCWRAISAGYRNVYEPASRVYHIGGGTLPKKSARKTYLNFRNNLFLLYKNLPTSVFIKVYFLRILLDGVAALKFLAGNSFADFRAVLRAHRHFLSSRGKVGKPKWKSTLKEHNVVLKYSLVSQHYIKGAKKFSDLRMPKQD